MAKTMYFSHEVDDESHFCVKCGQHLSKIQEKTAWKGNEVFPKCSLGNVVGISHIVRRD